MQIGLNFTSARKRYPITGNIGCVEAVEIENVIYKRKFHRSDSSSSRGFHYVKVIIPALGKILFPICQCKSLRRIYFSYRDGVVINRETG